MILRVVGTVLELKHFGKLKGKPASNKGLRRTKSAVVHNNNTVAQPIVPTSST